MASIHAKSRSARLLNAVLSSSVRSPSQTGKFLSTWLRCPIEYMAQKEMERTPITNFAEMFPLAAALSVSVPIENFNRHSWNVRVDEEMMIGLIIQALDAKQIFEIGTFNGSTTRHMAERAGLDCHVHTLDLPPESFNLTQKPDATFFGSRVGEKFSGTLEAGRITQLLGDSKTFDYSPYEGKCDFVFVDAGHDYAHGLPDSKNALKLARPGGVIVWHDYVPFWSGLIHGIREATAGLPSRRIGGTTLAVLRTKS